MNRGITQSFKRSLHGTCAILGRGQANFLCRMGEGHHQFVEQSNYQTRVFNGKYKYFFKVMSQNHFPNCRRNNDLMRISGFRFFLKRKALEYIVIEFGEDCI